MLRVGLTGGLGSGKSTVGAMLAGHGAHIISADEIGRELMQPGEAVYEAIRQHFGPGVVRSDGSLDRAELARLAFTEGRVGELNAMVHPAVIARQAQIAGEIGAREPDAVVVVESALIFETRYGGEVGWRRRFDRLVLVVADESLKIARFVARSLEGRAVSEEQIRAAEAEARRRLTQQIDDRAKLSRSDYVVRNAGTLDELAAQVDAIWPALAAEATQRQS